MSFTIFYNEKSPLQAIKTRSQNSRKIDIFTRGLTSGFGPKMAIIPTCFLSDKGKENAFYDILQRKNFFLGYKMSFTIFQNQKKPFYAIKTRSSKSRNIDIFTKRLTPGFGLKMTLILTCFFKQYKQGKCLSRYLTTKKLLSRL